MTTDQIWNLALSLISGLTLAWIGWVRKERREDQKEAQQSILNLREEINALKLKMAGDLPKKEDLKEIQQDVDAIRAMVSELRDMVIRMLAKEGR